MQPGTPDSTTCARRGTASEDEISNVAYGYSYIHLVRTYEMHANALTKVDNKDAFFKFCKIAMNY